MKAESERMSEFDTRRDLMRLIRGDQDEATRHGLHGCDVCDYQGFTREDLHHHKKALHDGRVYQCPTCGARANKKSALFTHFRRTHDEEKIHILYNI